jgi:hypothetical protein
LRFFFFKTNEYGCVDYLQLFLLRFLSLQHFLFSQPWWRYFWCRRDGVFFSGCAENFLSSSGADIPRLSDFAGFAAFFLLAAIFRPAFFRGFSIVVLLGIRASLLVLRLLLKTLYKDKKRAGMAKYILSQRNRHFSLYLGQISLRISRYAF